MSTIKSSDEHLTLNADGSSKDIKFQANGVEKASISSAGAFTSTTIDATALTGTIPNFTSTGIDDNADATAITIDSSENVGIGTSSPSQLLEISGESSPAIRLNDTTYNQYAEICTVNAGSLILKADVGNGGTGSTYIGFEVDGANEAMRIDSSGNVGIGAPSFNSNVRVYSKSLNGASAFATSNTSGTSGYNPMSFYNNGASHSYCGAISVTGSSTNFATSSDYRLKENVDYDWDATTRLKQLKPARFNFIADDSVTVDGFLAHEVSSVVPEAISGEKDAMTAEVLYVEGDELPEGKSIGDVKEASVPDMQGIDQSKLVPLLVKTIQELEARITALEA